MADSKVGKSSKEPIKSEDTTFSMKVVLAGVRKKFSDVKEISTDDLQKLLDAQPDTQLLLLDIREEKEFDVSRLSQAVWINDSSPVREKLKVLNEQLTRLSNNSMNNTNINVVAYCSIGYRSSALIQSAIHSGCDVPKNAKVNLYNLKGGIFQWANEKRFIVDAHNERTEQVHCYNVLWGKLLHKENRFRDRK